jgi:hypothetical protein
MSNFISKLFPKGSKNDKKTVISKLKMLVEKLEGITKVYEGKATAYRSRAKKLLKAGRKEQARADLVKFKMYSQKLTHYSNMKMKVEQHLEALNETDVIGDITGTLTESTKELGKAAKVVNPEVALSTMEAADENIDAINETAEIIGADPESDLGIDIEDEMQALESEFLLEQSGQLVESPDGDLDLELEEPDVESGGKTRSREKIKEEIDELKKQFKI